MSVKVAIIDALSQSVVAEIDKALPPDWSLAVAASAEPAAQQKALHQADVLFLMAASVGDSQLSMAPRLRFIQKLGGGFDQIDIEACRSRGVGVARLVGGNAVPVAEHTILLMLAAYRQLPRLDKDTRLGKWNREEYRSVNRQLRGKTIGIVGLGAIGREVARLLSGFGVTIVYSARKRLPPEIEAELGASFLALDELLSRSDIVTLHLSLSEETAGLLDAGRIAQMKPGALLVNTARGGLVDEEALVRAIEEGRLFGAAVDSYSTEPPVGNALLGLERTIVTPHAAGSTIENVASLAARAVSNARGYLAGDELAPADVILMPCPRVPADAFENLDKSK